MEETKKHILRLKCQKSAAMKSVDSLSFKLQNAKKLKEKIEELKGKEAFMTEEDIEEEERRTKEKLEKPLQILESIEELERHPDYLNPDQIQTLKTELVARKGPVDKTRLECVICLSLPDGNVYSCCQHHLLCQTCLEKVERCPICKQNFKAELPKRIPWAERMIAESQSARQGSNSGNITSKFI